MCKFSVDNVIVYLLYRPPSSPPESISEIAAAVRAAEKNSVFLGDFNVPEVDWSGVVGGRAAELAEAVLESLMEQLVEFRPT